MYKEREGSDIWEKNEMDGWRGEIFNLLNEMLVYIHRDSVGGGL